MDRGYKCKKCGEHVGLGRKCKKGCSMLSGNLIIDCIEIPIKEEENWDYINSKMKKDIYGKIICQERQLNSMIISRCLNG